MPQYALRTGRFPVNNRCYNFPLRTPPRLVAPLCGPKFPYRRRTPNRRTKRQVLNLLTDNEVAMRRFYFHLRAGDELVPDEEGIDLPDLSAARREAIEAARELLAEAIKDGRPEVPEAFVIADEEGREIDTVPLAAVLPENFKR
jgi:hypothetical protein